MKAGPGEGKSERPHPALVSTRSSWNWLLQRRSAVVLVLAMAISALRRSLIVLLLPLGGLSWAGPVSVRIVAANLTSDDHQSWSPDNGNHSNPEGAGARILKALRPDIVLLQEFNTSVPVRQWVNDTLGVDFSVAREEGAGIPNGIVSRFPIVNTGEWDDPVLENRDFAWARIALPGGRILRAVSVHLHSKTAASRNTEAETLLGRLAKEVPGDEMVVLGGDFNTRGTEEACLVTLGRYFVVPSAPPACTNGIIGTNAPRNRPYDWVLADPKLQALAAPVVVAGRTFPKGLVFDTRTFPALGDLPPAQAGDSALKQMQHMAVVRQFILPEETKPAPGAGPAPEKKE